MLARQVAPPAGVDVVVERPALGYPAEAVRIAADGLVRERGQFAQARFDGLRVRAVEQIGVDGQPLKRGQRRRHALAAAQASARRFVERPGNVHRLAARHCRAGRMVRLGSRRHGLAQKHVHVVRQRPHHVLVDRQRLRGWRHQIGAVALRERRQRTGHPHTPRTAAALVRRPTRQTPGKAREFPTATLEPRLAEIARNGRVGVGGNQVGAGCDVVAVNVHDHLWLLKQCHRRPNAGCSGRHPALDLAADAAVKDCDHGGFASRHQGIRE